MVVSLEFSRISWSQKGMDTEKITPGSTPFGDLSLSCVSCLCACVHKESKAPWKLFFLLTTTPCWQYKCSFFFCSLINMHTWKWLVLQMICGVYWLPALRALRSAVNDMCVDLFHCLFQLGRPGCAPGVYSVQGRAGLPAEKEEICCCCSEKDSSFGGGSERAWGKPVQSLVARPLWGLGSGWQIETTNEKTA